MEKEELNAKNTVEDAVTIDAGVETKKVKDRQQELVELWVKNEFNIEKLALNYADMEHDFAYVKDMNRFVAEKFQSVIDVLPNSEELNLFINLLTSEDRIHRLKLLKSVVVALEEQGVNVLVKRYEE